MRCNVMWIDVCNEPIPRRVGEQPSASMSLWVIGFVLGNSSVFWFFWCHQCGFESFDLRRVQSESSVFFFGEGCSYWVTTLPETNIFAPENGCLEDDRFLFGGFWPIFRGGLLLVPGSVFFLIYFLVLQSPLQVVLDSWRASTLERSLVH